jgi:hypothetical protein
MPAGRLKPFAAGNELLPGIWLPVDCTTQLK